MSTKFIPKRAHKKSRAGCLTCKTRKVKVRIRCSVFKVLTFNSQCDELQPSCSFCTTRSIPCVYRPGKPTTMPLTPVSLELGSSTGSDSPPRTEKFDGEVILSPLYGSSLGALTPGDIRPTDLRFMYHVRPPLQSLIFCSDVLSSGRHLHGAQSVFRRKEWIWSCN